MSHRSNAEVRGRGSRAIGPIGKLLLLLAFAAFAAAPAAAQQGKGAGPGAGGQGGSEQGQKKGPGVGQQGEGRGHVPEAAEDEDSDRPDWAGVPGGPSGGGTKPPGAGTKKGDLFGDLWIILRDANGVPILNEDGYVQPIDADGNPIPLDDEGAPIDESLVQEVDLSRLNIVRAPDKVVEKALDEAVSKLASADSVTIDAAGRLVVVTDGVASTIDAPLENIALYEAIMKTGTIPEVGIPVPLPPELLAAMLLGAATDKSLPFTVDAVVYLNSMLGINTDPSDPTTYYTFSDFDYTRSTAFLRDVTYLKDNGDGTFTTVTEPAYVAVFDSQDYTSTDGGVDGFTQAADDARTVIDFIHTYAPPE